MTTPTTDETTIIMQRSNIARLTMNMFDGGLSDFVLFKSRQKKINLLTLRRSEQRTSERCKLEPAKDDSTSEVHRRSAAGSIGNVTILALS